MFRASGPEGQKASGLTDEDIPSKSWFRFQFWPKNPYTHTALNYTGCLNIRYMVQQRAIRKHSDDDHYCAALYKYAREMAVRFGEHCVFMSTNDKNKFKVGEPDCPISAVTRGRQVLVGLNQLVKSADHDFASMALIPTVILVHDIPDEVDKSWYRGHAHIYMKISATESSSALRNAAEIENVLIQRYGRRGLVPPILIIYTDGGPEHRTT